MRVFSLRAPILSSIGDRTEWHMGPACPECHRGSRYPDPFHLLLHRWDSHHVFRLMWMLVISEPFAESLDKMGHPVPTQPVEIEQMLQQPLEVGATIPPFYRVDFQKILPNRLERFCPACNISYIKESSYIRLSRTPPEPAIEIEEPTPTSGVAMTSDAMLFDVDLRNLEPIFTVGRQMVAVIEPIVRLFDTTPEIEIKEIPIQKNPLGYLQRPEAGTDW